MKGKKLRIMRMTHIKLAILTTLSLILSSFFYSRRVTLLQNAIDTALQNKGLSAFLGNVILFLGFLILTIAFDFIASFVSAVNKVGMFRNLVESQIKLMLNADTNDLKRKNTGEIITRVFDDGWYVIDIYAQALPELISLSFKVALLVVAFYQLSPWLLLIALLLSPIYGFPISTSRKKIKDYQQKERSSFEECVKFINETMSGINVIKAFESKNVFYKEFGKRSNLWMSALNNLFNVIAKTESLFPFLNGLLPITVVTLSSILVARGKITIGSAISFYYFVSGFYGSVSGVYSSALDFIRLGIYRRRIQEIAQLNPEKEGKKVLRDIKEIRLQNVSFNYPDGKEILTDLNLRIKRGDKIAIVGASGVGKSTLVSLFNRLLSPTKGKILINNIPIEEFSLSSLRKSIILVRSNDMLFDTSIRNNITFFEHFPKEEIEKVLKICECDFVERLENGIDTPVGEKGAKLSDGQRQRILLAGALLRKPEVLILDEATSGIDSETEERILERILKEINTVIIISHRLSTVRKASKIILMNGGKVEAEGTHEELMEKSPLYRNIVKNQLVM
ncbi:ABC-type multidrug transport system, ATPase and permease component [Fervidobacterium pennivorans DSM 9078]|uniref:ABC-type multidrug transport system, ATPase and permease component n=2 Tax=Fervidobacterium pennivorans TaxID=93466 RepID=H9UCD6_FERPD|nr:ABC transporter ATP-binding protein [Fervidobacterium pennivorans]AFG35179.1 ABC-type multidrug transport system, ATPase and permease component [Fervidobacterium pennivorans DSM 9078]